MPIVTVDYDEDKPEIYRGVVLKNQGGEEKRCNTGDFVDDFKAISDYFKKTYPGMPMMCSSSVDHYLSDSKLDVIWEE